MYKDKNRLVRFILIIVMALTTFMCFTSCTPEDQCGTVTGWDIDNQGNYVVYIDGDKHIVMASTWYDAQVGEYMCVEY